MLLVIVVKHWFVVLQELTNDWMAVLRPLCVPQMVGAPKLQTLKFMKSLHLTIMQATRLPSKIVPSPYCLVSLNQVSSWWIVFVQLCSSSY